MWLAVLFFSFLALSLSLKRHMCAQAWAPLRQPSKWVHECWERNKNTIMPTYIQLNHRLLIAQYVLRAHFNVWIEHTHTVGVCNLLRLLLFVSHSTESVFVFVFNIIILNSISFLLQQLFFFCPLLYWSTKQYSSAKCTQVIWISHPIDCGGIALRPLEYV